MINNNLVFIIYIDYNYYINMDFFFCLLGIKHSKTLIIILKKNYINRLSMTVHATIPLNTRVIIVKIEKHPLLRREGVFLFFITYFL